MKALVLDFGAYTMPDILSAFKNLNIDYKLYSYHFNNKNEDEFFEYMFLKYLSSEKYDFVFSVNYFPIIASCCNQKNIKYISWSYDNPLNVYNIEDTLGLETNYVFLFDRIQTENYLRKGYKSVYHVPLAVNTKRLDSIVPTKEDMAEYGCDFSFVGKLYESPLTGYLNLMDEFSKGYIDGIKKVQSSLYGAYIVDNALNQTFIDHINDYINAKYLDSKLSFTKEALSYAIAAQVTREERLLLLSLLSNHFKGNLFTKEDASMLPKLNFKGSCGYLVQMPKVFKCSKINLNMSLKIIQSGISLRLFDIMGSNGFVLSNYQIELAELFENEKEVVMYESIEDAYEKAAFYIKHDDLRKKISQNGYIKVRDYYSYEKMISKILSIAKVG